MVQDIRIKRTAGSGSPAASDFGDVAYSATDNVLHIYDGSAWQGFASLDSPTFTGTPTAPTPSLGDDSTNIATTEFVQNQIDQSTIVTATCGFGGEFSTLKAAVDAGHRRIAIIGTSTETADITFNTSTEIIFVNHSLLFMNNVRFLMGANGLQLRISGSGLLLWLFTSSNVLFDRNAKTNCQVSIHNVDLFNISSTANTSLINEMILRMSFLKFTVPNQTDGGVDLTDEESFIHNIRFIGSGTSCDEVLKMTSGTATDIIFSGSYSTTGVIAEARTGAIFTNFIMNTAGASLIEVDGELNGVRSPSSQDVNVTITADNSVVVNCDLEGGDLDVDSFDRCMVDNVVTTGVIDLSDASCNNAKVKACRCDSAVTVGGDFNKISDTEFVGGVTVVSGADNNTITGCQAGANAGGGSENITINSGANRTLVTGCRVDNSSGVSDSGTGSGLANNTRY